MLVIVQSNLTSSNITRLKLEFHATSQKVTVSEIQLFMKSTSLEGIVRFSIKT